MTGIPSQPSAETIRLNPQHYGPSVLRPGAMVTVNHAAESPAVLVIGKGRKSPAPHDMRGILKDAPKPLRHRRRKMNATEARFESFAYAQFPVGEGGVKFEAMSLAWGGTAETQDMRYKADFFIETHPKPTLCEVKGAHERSRDLVRFRGCRAEWSHRFVFEYWQFKDKQWTRLE